MIRQVYIRSTARVYEIYYSPTWKAADEYLCTVNCSTAKRDGEVLQATAYGNVEEESTTFVGESTKSDSPSETSGSSENDWVEVRNPIASYESTDSSLSDNDGFDMGSSIQDLYEATAEINDADPCTSITIRLLSLQNKSHVYVDEIYVFADLVADPSGSENQEVQMGGSAGNALMDMLVPTIMQLSKSSSSEVQEKIISEKRITNDEVAPKLVGRSEVADGGEEDEKLRAEQQYVMYDNRARQNPPQVPSHYPAVHAPPVENDMPHRCMEGLLEQLVLRVSRIEDYFSRLEENILKPMNSMDARLIQVEQKLEILVNNSDSFGLQRGTRFSAPSFSCGESSSSSICNDTSRDTPPTSELKESDTHFIDPCKHCHGSPAPESSLPVLPGFRITAPDLACSEDDEDDNVYTLGNADVLISSGCTSVETPKQTFCIDDALAKAHSGFFEMSSRNKSEEAGVQVLVANSDATVKALPPTLIDLIIATEINTQEPSEYSNAPIISAPGFTTEFQVYEEFIESKQSHSVSASQYMTKDDVTGNMPSEKSDTAETSNTPQTASGSVECGGTVVADINPPLNLTELLVDPFFDLKFPILEVKFGSHESSMTESPLQVLLYDASNIRIQTCGLGSLDEGRVAQEAEFTSEDDRDHGADDLHSDYNLLVDLSFDDIDELSNSSNRVDDPSTSSNHEILASLI